MVLFRHNHGLQNIQEIFWKGRTSKWATTHQTISNTDCILSLFKLWNKSRCSIIMLIRTPGYKVLSYIWRLHITDKILVQPCTHFLDELNINGNEDKGDFISLVSKKLLNTKTVDSMYHTTVQTCHATWLFNLIIDSRQLAHVTENSISNVFVVTDHAKKKFSWLIVCKWHFRSP